MAHNQQPKETKGRVGKIKKWGKVRMRRSDLFLIDKLIIISDDLKELLLPAEA